MEEEWIYVTEEENTVRYVLGTKGKNTLCCLGINPSTAEPNKPDATIRSVRRIAENNGYDSFIMFNVYPVRSTIFEKLSQEDNKLYNERNIKEILNVIRKLPRPVNIWLAYGNLIDKRNYMRKSFNNLKTELDKFNCEYWCCGLTKNKNPKHPLYLKGTTKLQKYN